MFEDIDIETMEVSQKVLDALPDEASPEMICQVFKTVIQVYGLTCITPQIFAIVMLLMKQNQPTAIYNDEDFIKELEIEAKKIRKIIEDQIKFIMSSDVMTKH